MAEDRVYMRMTPENFLTVGMLSAVAFFGLVIAKQMVRIIVAKTGDTGDKTPAKSDDNSADPKTDDRVM